jgi:hypothetical protein
MLKVITRTILVLVVAVLVSGELYAFAKSSPGWAWLGISEPSPAAAASSSQGSGAATLKSSNSSQGSQGSQTSSDYKPPNTLMDVLQKLGIVLFFTVGVVILQKILSLFINNRGDRRTSKDSD